MTEAQRFPRTTLLGGTVDLVQRHEVLDFIAEAITQGVKVVVGNQNLHSLVLARSDSAFRRFFDRAHLIEIDSMPLVYWGRLLGLRVHRRHRATYLDWRDPFWRRAARQGWRVFLLGAEPGVAHTAKQRLELEFPGVAIACHHGFFDRTQGGVENDLVIQAINAFRPDVTLVGMGMPIQEVWVDRNIDALRGGAYLTVGAAIDYEAGLQPPAPRILGDLCLEWLFRLACDPVRLWRRYMLEPWALSGEAWRDLRQSRRLHPRAGPLEAAVTLVGGVGAEGEPGANEADISQAA